ncbi:MAG: hypothetical protein ACPHY8_03755, partial [Patescibacteria group bacterium]
REVSFFVISSILSEAFFERFALTSKFFDIFRFDSQSLYSTNLFNCEIFSCNPRNSHELFQEELLFRVNKIKITQNKNITKMINITSKDMIFYK